MAAQKTVEVYLSNRVVVISYKDSSKSTAPKQVRGMASLWSEKSDADLATLLKKVDGVVDVFFQPRDI